MDINNEAAQQLSFAEISLEQKDKIESVRKASHNTLYVYSFASLFSWQDDEQYEICLKDDAFLVKNGALGDNAYLFPCGTDSGKKQLIDALTKNESPVFCTMSDEDKSFLEREYPNKFSFEECRDEFSYLYDKEEQITMSGKTFKSLRHQVNVGRAFAENWSLEPICAENVDRALAINQRWADERNADDLADTLAAQTALRHFEELSMWGVIFKADGEDTAYAAGCFVTPEIFDISFCKVLDNSTDCYIKWALYNELPSEVKIIDSEEDLGLEGLRTHKLLRQPKELTRIWKGTYI